MEKLQIDCDEYILYSPDSLKYITDNMHNIFLSKIEVYKILFKLDVLNKIQINYFDNLETFRDFIYKLRGEKETLPQYAQGTYDNGMINAYISNSIDPKSQKYTNKLYMACHELFHIMYMKYILQDDYSKRITWYDEGMAQFMSGENDYLLNPEKFWEYFNRIKFETKRRPNMNELAHGNSFCNDEYNGYSLSYLCIRYLNELLTTDEFKTLLGNFGQIKNYGVHIVSDMFNYYEQKYKNHLKR
jgi:hypothetical protein